MVVFSLNGDERVLQAGSDEETVENLVADEPRASILGEALVSKHIVDIN